MLILKKFEVPDKTDMWPEATWGLKLGRVVCIAAQRQHRLRQTHAWGMGVDGHIDIEGRVYFPHSLGMFYSALTQHLGFPHYGDEYKVMGLAPYGEPKYLSEMRKIVLLKNDGTFELNLDCFRHHKEQVPYV